MAIKASIKAHGFERFQNKKHLSPAASGAPVGPFHARPLWRVRHKLRELSLHNRTEAPRRAKAPLF